LSNRFSIQHLILHVNQTAEYLSVLYSSSSSRFKGNSSGDIWEFIEFVDQPSSVIDWTSNHHYQNNNPNQIIRKMARELEESTVGPLQTSLNKNLLRQE